MGKTTEKKVTIICDACLRNTGATYEIKCPRCNRDLCYTCSHQLYDSYRTGICPKCLEGETIKSLFEKAHKHFYKERDKILADFGKGEDSNG